MEAAEELLRAAIEHDDRAQIDQWAALVDRLEAMQATKPIPTLGTAAIWYATLGLHVFPLGRRSKVPRKGSNGLHEATSDVGTVATWWAYDPHANVGVATGHLVDVVDIDGEAGERSWARLIECDRCRAAAEAGAVVDPAGARCEDCDTLDDYDVLGIVSTPTAGGRHLYLRAREGARNGASLVPKVDMRAAGGYVVAPPSVLPRGAYTWLRLLDVAALSARPGAP